MLQSEWTKLRSLRSTWIIVSLAIGLSIGFSALFALVTGLTFDSLSDGVRVEFDPLLSTQSGWLFGMVLLIVLGVTSVTSEYSSRMMRTTFIVTPRRNRVFAARAAVVGLLGVAITTIVIPGMFLVSQPIFSHYGLEMASVTDSDAARFLIIGGIVQGLFHTLIPFSIAWLLRGAASAITVSLAVSMLPWMLLPLVPRWVQENVFRYFPDLAKDSLLGVSKAGDATYLGDAASTVVIAVWLIGLLVAAAVVLHRRDV
jgi:hypothetical protein